MLWIAGPGHAPVDLHLQRRELDELLGQRQLLELLDELLEQVLASARGCGISEAEIDAVLPVGGCSRVPLIRTWLQERLPRVPLHGERPVEAVALGALRLTPGVAVKDLLPRASPCAAGINAAASTAGTHCSCRAALAERAAPAAATELQPTRARGAGAAPRRTAAGRAERSGVCERLSGAAPRPRAAQRCKPGANNPQPFPSPPRDPWR